MPHTPLLVGVRGASAAQLQNTVYVFGGRSGKRYLSTTQKISDVGVCSEAAAMPTPRSCASAVEIGGLIYVIGGWNGIDALNTVEIYDPATNTWASGPPLHIPRKNACAVPWRGGILVMGGWDERSTLSSTEYLPVGASDWVRYPPMAVPRECASAAVADGKVWVFGGFTGDGLVCSTEVFQGGTTAAGGGGGGGGGGRRGVWSSGPPFPAPARECTVAAAAAGCGAIDDGVALYLMGGWDGFRALDTVHRLDPATRLWSRQPPLLEARNRACGCVVAADTVATAVDGTPHSEGGSNGDGGATTREQAEEGKQSAEASDGDRCDTKAESRGSVQQRGYFGQHKYWDTRFVEMTAAGCAHEEWMADYSALKSLLVKHAPKDAPLLHLGAGLSALPLHMSNDGYSHQACIDYSEHAVHSMQQTLAAASSSSNRHSDATASPGDAAASPADATTTAAAAAGPPPPPVLRYEVMDACRLTFAAASFGCVVDKGLLDPLFFLADDRLETNMDRIVAQVWRVLRPGGVFLALILGNPRDRRHYFNHQLELPGGAKWRILSTTLVREATASHKACYCYVLQKPNT